MRNSQIRDLPNLPLSNSEDAQYPRDVPLGKASKQKKIEFGKRDVRGERLQMLSDSAAACGLTGMLEPYSRSVKEVIQPQVPLRLPCYDFAPVTALAFGRLVPCRFRHGLRALTASMA